MNIITPAPKVSFPAEPGQNPGVCPGAFFLMVAATALTVPTSGEQQASQTHVHPGTP